MVIGTTAAATAITTIITAVDTTAARVLFLDG